MTAPVTVEAVMDLADNYVLHFGKPYSDAEAAKHRVALRAAVELLAQQARAKALEDAAKVCDAVADEDNEHAFMAAAGMCVDRVRAMK